MNPYVLSTAIPVTVMAICHKLGVKAELHSDGEIVVWLSNIQDVAALCNLINENFTATLED